MPLNRRAFLAAGSSSLALAACGSRTGSPDRCASAAATAPRAFAGRPSGWGDDDPHDWIGRAPYGYPVHGINVSRWNGPSDWQEAARSGVSFAFIKATEGGDLVDPLFAEHWNSSAAAAIPHGAFHFWYHCRDGESQARWFIENVPRQPGMLPPVLDMEWTPFSPTCTRRAPPAEIRREMLVWLRIVGAHYGQRPLIYVVPDFFDDTDLSTFSGYDWWLRSTAAHPSERYPGTPWRIWQYSGTGRVPGFATRTDLNTFNGSPQAFAVWRAARSVS